MGQFSPTVLPTWGEAFGHALSGGINTFLQTRRQKMEDEENMYGKGLQAVDPNAPKPGGLVADNGVHGSAGWNEQPTPFQPGTPAETNAGIVRGVQSAQQPAVDPALLHQALSAHVQSGQPLQSPQAQPSPQQVGQALDPYSQPVHLMGRDWTMTPQAKAQMQIANSLRMAEIGQKNAETYKNQREAGQLRPGDAGFVENEGAVAGAKANAETPAMVTRATQIAAATLPLRIQEMVAQGQISLATGLQLGQQRGSIEAGLQGQRQSFEQGQQGRQQDFERTQLPARLQGEQANRIAAIDYTQGGQIVPSVVRELKSELRGKPAARAPLPGTTAPSPAPDSPFADLVPKRKK